MTESFVSILKFTSWYVPLMSGYTCTLLRKSSKKLLKKKMRSIFQGLIYVKCDVILFRKRKGYHIIREREEEFILHVENKNRQRSHIA